MNPEQPKSHRKTNTRPSTGQLNAVYARKRIQKQKQKHQLYTIVLILLMLSLAGILHYKTVSSASAEAPRIKCYKSIEIQTGDSLLGIAQEYYTEDWDSVYTLMEEIRTFNGISGENIHSGRYLAVPYFTDP